MEENINMDFLNSRTSLENGTARVYETVQSVTSFMSEILERFTFLTPIIVKRLYDQWVELSELGIPDDEIIGLSDFSELTGNILKLPIKNEDLNFIENTIRDLSGYSVSSSLKNRFRLLLPENLQNLL